MYMTLEVDEHSHTHYPRLSLSSVVGSIKWFLFRSKLRPGQVGAGYQKAEAAGSVEEASLASASTRRGTWAGRRNHR